MRTSPVSKPPVPTAFLEECDWRFIIEALHLTMREADIVGSILAGESEARLAARLGISAHTVHTYTDRLYRRLGVSSRCQVAVRVFEVYVRQLKS
jgi:DNA-binding CsgD family transcriptional regulator